ncbi:MAG: beta-lactamase family protein [Caulobacteraceae bacterium]|nr:beta-lactamase family protein [Caulobacteraceae bacterium]
MTDALPDIRGIIPGRFGAVKDLFARHFAEGLEIGARFTVAIEGEIVLDLIGGFADRSRTRPWDETTLAPVFSTGKAVMALMMARLVDQGRIDYDTTIASLWPEFGQNGKAGVTLGQLMSHQAGLPGFAESQDPLVWYDRNEVLRLLCEQAPMWPPGTASGYHPVTIGYLANEVFRRIDGRNMGAAVREDLALPFDLDLWLGLPESEYPRVPEIRKPPAPPVLGEIDAIKRSAFLDRGSSPGGKGDADWRRMDTPSTHLHATAPALARILGVVANEGRIGGAEVLDRMTLAKATRERVHGPDKVLPFTLSWAAGFLRNAGLNIYGPGELTVGHSGWGGSCAFADPEMRVSGAYVMNRQSPHLLGDPRPVALINAVYAGL